MRTDSIELLTQCHVNSINLVRNQLYGRLIRFPFLLPTLKSQPGSTATGLKKEEEAIVIAMNA